MWWLILPSLLLGCNDPGFDGVSIRPTYGWADGCTDVTIGGHGFDDGVSATIGGNEVTGITLPDPEAKPLDVGYLFYGLTPPGDVGFADMIVTNGDGTESEPVTNAFYYVACPGSPHIDSFAPTDVSGGTAVTIAGCGFAQGMTAELVTVDDPSTVLASAPLNLTCSTAVTSFEAPNLDAGTYLVLLTDGAGTVLYGANLCDTADTAGGCESPLYLTYGGGT